MNQLGVSHDGSSPEGTLFGGEQEGAAIRVLMARQTWGL